MLGLCQLAIVNEISPTVVKTNVVIPTLETVVIFKLGAITKVMVLERHVAAIIKSDLIICPSLIITTTVGQRQWYWGRYKHKQSRAINVVSKTTSTETVTLIGVVVEIF